MLDLILTIFYRIDILQICFLFNINFMQTLLSTLDFVLNWNFLLHIYVVMVNNSDAQQIPVLHSLGNFQSNIQTYSDF